MRGGQCPVAGVGELTDRTRIGRVARPGTGGIRTVSQLPTLRCRYATLVSSRRNDVTQSGVSSTYVTAANARYAHVYAIRYEGFSPELRLPSPQALVERGSHESLRSDSGSSPVPSDTRYVSNRTGTRLPTLPATGHGLRFACVHSRTDSDECSLKS